MPGSHRGPRDQKRDLFDRWLAHHDGTATEDDAGSEVPAEEPRPAAPAAQSSRTSAPTAPARPVEAPPAQAAPPPPAPPAPEPPAPASPAPADPAPATGSHEATHPLPAIPPERPTTNVEFEARTANRRLVGEILLVIVLMTGLATYFAITDPTTLTIGLAGTLGVLSLILWGIRAGAPTAQMSVQGGQLVVVQSGTRMVFDLTSHYTPIEVVGRPRDRDWKVLFLRRGMDPFVIDASMVDPEHFMKVLRQHRPK